MVWQKRKNKFGAIKTVVNGKTCDSKLEAGHYKKLLIAEKGGAIKDLIFHPRFPIVINDKKICTVVLDFQYIDCDTNKIHYIDSKGVYTSESKLRHKILEVTHDIKIEIWRGS